MPLALNNIMTWSSPSLSPSSSGPDLGCSSPVYFLPFLYYILSPSLSLQSKTRSGPRCRSVVCRHRRRVSHGEGGGSRRENKFPRNDDRGGTGTKREKGRGGRRRNGA